MSKVLGIAQFAKAAGVEEASARVMLRKISHPRKERSYEFKSMDEIKKLIEKIRKSPAAPKKTKKASPKKKAKPPQKVVVKKKKLTPKKKTPKVSSKDSEVLGVDS